MLSNFQQVTRMNHAFGNPKGDPATFDIETLRNQLLNIPDELGETLIAMGYDPEQVKREVGNFVAGLKSIERTGSLDIDGVRDGMIDQHVFLYGGHNIIGCDADQDMVSVIQGVMTRFIKNLEDEVATRAKHAIKGVTDVYFEGDYPTRVMKSASNQPDAPKGKFLKSASYSEPKFYKVETHQSLIVKARDFDDSRVFCGGVIPKYEAPILDQASFAEEDLGIEYTFDQFVQHGRDNGGNIVNGIPWSWKFHGHAVTNHTETCYLLLTSFGDIKVQPGDVVTVGSDGGVSVRSVKATSPMNAEARALLDKHNAMLQ